MTTSIQAVPEWALDVLHPGYAEIDGILSYGPECAGSYMAGQDWPDVTDASPVPRLRSPCLAEFGPLVQELSRRGEPPTVLSVCDGGGHPSAILASEYPDLRIISIDLSLDALRFFAPKMHRYFGLAPNRIVRVQSSALHLPIEEHSIDAVVGVGAIHHLQLLHTFFRECARVLRPNGLVHFTGERLWTGVEPDDTDESDITRTARQYHRALESNGFSSSVGTGDGELNTYARRYRLPAASWRLARRAIPRLRALAGRCATVTVAGRLKSSGL
jgi:SAM-dependent methyltransferase